MKTVLVFKTSVVKSKEVSSLKPLLDQLIRPAGRWNFDLEDCDHILRVETKQLGPKAVMSTLMNSGFSCEEL